VFVQRITPYRFYGAISFVGVIIFTTAGGITQINPVGGFIAGSGKALFVHKSFKVIDVMAVDCLPVLTDNFGHASQYVGSKAANPNPGQDG